jgi:hypothetical protein
MGLDKVNRLNGYKFVFPPGQPLQPQAAVYLTQYTRFWAVLLVEASTHAPRRSRRPW